MPIVCTPFEGVYIILRRTVHEPKRCALDTTPKSANHTVVVVVHVHPWGGERWHYCRCHLLLLVVVVMAHTLQLQHVTLPFPILVWIVAGGILKGAAVERMRQPGLAQILEMVNGWNCTQRVRELDAQYFQAAQAVGREHFESRIGQISE